LMRTSIVMSKDLRNLKMVRSFWCNGHSDTRVKMTLPRKRSGLNPASDSREIAVDHANFLNTMRMGFLPLLTLVGIFYAMRHKMAGG